MNKIKKQSENILENSKHQGISNQRKILLFDQMNNDEMQRRRLA